MSVLLDSEGRELKASEPRSAAVEAALIGGKMALLVALLYGSFSAYTGGLTRIAQATLVAFWAASVFFVYRLLHHRRDRYRPWLTLASAAAIGACVYPFNGYCLKAIAQANARTLPPVPVFQLPPVPTAALTKTPPPLPRRAPQKHVLVNSIIRTEGQGSVDDVQITNPIVMAPRNGEATIVDQRGTRKNTHIKADNPLVLPESHLSVDSSSTGVVGGVGPGHTLLRGFFEDNTYCDSDTFFSAQGRGSELYMRNNTPVDCEWISFLLYITDPALLKKNLEQWRAALQKSWAKLPEGEKSENRRELKVIEDKLLGGLEAGQLRQVEKELEKTPPHFPLEWRSVIRPSP